MHFQLMPPEATLKVFPVFTTTVASSTSVELYPLFNHNDSRSGDGIQYVVRIKLPAGVCGKVYNPGQEQCGLGGVVGTDLCPPPTPSPSPSHTASRSASAAPSNTPLSVSLTRSESASPAVASPSSSAVMASESPFVAPASPAPPSGSSSVSLSASRSATATPGMPISASNSPVATEPSGLSQGL
eukprot:g47543.t1